MNQEQIIAGNKLIVEFMNVKPTFNSYSNKYTWNDGIFFSVATTTEELTMNAIVKYVKYHTEWNWLMPVVKKIQSVTEEPEEIDDLRDMLWLGSVSDVYEVVVDTIDRYNRQSKTNQNELYL